MQAAFFLLPSRRLTLARCKEAERASSGRAAWLSSTGSTAGFCCLPLCTITKESLLDADSVAVTLGLLRYQARSRTGSQQLCRGTCSCPSVRLALSCAPLLSPQHFKSWAVALNECLKWLGVIYLQLWTFRSCRHLLHILGKLLGSLGGFHSRKWVQHFFVLHNPPFISQSLLSGTPLFFFQFCTYSCVWNNEKKCTLKHPF